MTKFTVLQDETVGCPDLTCESENRSENPQNDQDDNGASATPFRSTLELTQNPDNINGVPHGFECKGVIVAGKMNDIHHGATNTTKDGANDKDALSPSTFEEIPGANQTNVSLDDYKCPICLDIFINTVKVDCCYGHKFCNFCIQCWINFERHLVTECPVCRGPIFGKSLDLKTDAEIRAIFDSLTEDEKKARLLAIKERLQLEYPNSNIQQIVNGSEVPMRISNNSSHNFNHDLNIPIPLIGFVPGEPAQFVSNYLQENVFPQNTGDQITGHPMWSPEMFHPSNWEDYVAQDFHNMNDAQHSYQSQRVDLDHSNIRHQHYRHQNQENSLWDNNLYVTPVAEDTRTLNRIGSPSGSIPTVSPTEPQFINQMSTNNRQNQFHENPSAAGHHSACLIQPQRSTPNVIEEHTYNVNSVIAPPQTPQNVHNRNPQQFVAQSPLPTSFHQQQSSQPTPTNPFNGFYCCYIPSCPNNHYATQQTTHYTPPPPSTYLPFQVQQGINSHQGFSNNGYHCTRQTPCHYATPSNNPVQANFWNACSGNLSAASYFPPRIRPNMPGASSMPLQLPSPNNAPSSSHTPISQISNPDFSSRLIATLSPIHFQTNSTGIQNNSQRANPSHRNAPTSRSRTPVSSNTARVTTSTENRGRQSVQVSSCAVVRSNNNRAQFAGGFSLFSAGGHVNFQISHTPKTMMVGDRQMTMPPGRLTHPLVSLVPMSHDGSSTRVSLTFEVHRV